MAPNVLVAGSYHHPLSKRFGLHLTTPPRQVARAADASIRVGSFGRVWMTAADLLYLALILVLLLLDYFVLWPTFLRRSEADPGRARTWLWSSWMIVLWTLAGSVVTLWLVQTRPWGALRFVTPQGWRLWGSIGLVLAFAITSARPIVRIARAKRPMRIKMGNRHVERYSPHTKPELGWWVAASLSAGFCEELVFRGYLIWAFQPMLGLGGAAVFSVVVFALGHAYQGVKGVFATGLIGAILTVVVLGLGSLLPAMALHALADISQGVMAWLAFRTVQDAPSPTRSA